jgi:DtxR family transcriptional regulator, Mn-dependent transcriptional regulator
MYSKIEENYLKAIYKIAEKHGNPVSTNQIAREVDTSAASVTDMMKRLSQKGALNYERYRGVTLTEDGYKHTRKIIRKHRIWEVFLYEKLKYTTKDVLRPLLKQLNYIKSDDIVDRMDEFLAYPKVNPEGLSIPDKEGQYEHRNQFSISDMEAGEDGILVGIEDLSDAFFAFIDKLGLRLGSRITVAERYDFDDSIKILIEGKDEHIVSSKVASSLLMKKAPNR